MDRRCVGDSCLAAAGVRGLSLDMPLANLLVNPKQEWNRIASGGKRMMTARNISVDWKKYNQDSYLFSHCSIVASVEVEKNGYYIKTACNDLVNNNGNAWTNEVLLATFKTFIGGENYLEHIQVPELSKGKLLDVVLRPIVYVDKNGRKANIYFCDILVATHKKHNDLVKDIVGGKLTTMSMGCTCDWVTCSKCGKVVGDNTPNCSHIENELLTKFIDGDGIERIVSELCGRSILDANGKWVGDPKSVKFIEASWVRNPAFVGAVLNHYVSDISKFASSVLHSSNKNLFLAMEDIFKMRVADKNGMLVLRVAQAEVAKRMREERFAKIANLL